jgi:hypothetical protein
VVVRFASGASRPGSAERMRSRKYGVPAKSG